MHPNLFPTTVLCILIVLIFSINVPTTLCLDDFHYTNCSQNFDCSGIETVNYPFWGVNRPDYCGLPGFEVTCQDDVPMITMMQGEYRVINIASATSTLQVAREDYWGNICPQYFYNTTLNFSLFNYASGLMNLTIFYKCNLYQEIPNVPSALSCPINGTNINAYYAVTGSTAVQGLRVMCNSSVIVPIFESVAQALVAGSTNIFDALDEGFELQWRPSNDQCNTCMVSGGQCGYNRTSSQFTCFCKDQPSNAAVCSSKPSGM
ncbi:GUB_WAK_bind domain-containing protein/WAK_assoc domain-containing protein [Cephalotus follicularis]|uniref:non-specific serine/threonine protein kinase n=1 Tax=Cephalotus follicularis TaxID=3775 RepID=A0A1Q3CZ90_CEPFO|nr:GUB_WAK_bind domain-containing protein/WAK_assoc domain-containing protein [Cephalotus follicularis]